VELNPFRDQGAREGDGLILAFELVLTTTIFAALGYWIDTKLGTTPFLTILLAAFTLTYEVWKIVTNYDSTMAEHAERRDPLRRGPAR
jgi:F0F1-type ATP synthase assembly protein I